PIYDVLLCLIRGRVGTTRDRHHRTLTVIETSAASGSQGLASFIGMGIVVEMRYFAAAADAAGADSEEVTVGRGATIEDLRTKIGELHGAEMARVLGLCSFLLRGQAADLDTVIPPGEGVRIDVLPPFAGG